ncbi:MAG TPA: 3-hydroxyacyl-CoA dehydrogenase NAD-binding domain-containing protein [Candidatus Baltobacteraceae bacterium]|nr:3-hydroxyacyl-CoA dehydrogenase NAD-binding domain-containing protein [Candidatus Baltobacteraceae bacterium]
MNVRRVAVAGTGMMGPGIALTFALAGREAIVVSRTAENAAKGVATAKSLIDKLLENGLTDAAQAKAAKARLSPGTNAEEAARSVQLFVESIAENLAIKQDYFARLDKAAPDTVLCSNTSGISISEIAAKCSKPERVFTTHFWNPPYLMPLVEVIVGKRSDIKVAEEIVILLRECGKVPVLVRKDVPGQLGNRIQHAMIRECMHIVAEGIATPEDVDLAVKAGVGLRFPVYGVYEHADLVGLDLVKAVQDYVVPDLSTVKGASPIHNETIAKGNIGAKTGKGFLDWPPGKAEAVRARRDAFLMEFLRLEKARKFA